jgi:hypothetical protein
MLILNADLQQAIDKYSKQYEIPDGLLNALISSEIEYNPKNYNFNKSSNARNSDIAVNNSASILKKFYDNVKDWDIAAQKYGSEKMPTMPDLGGKILEDMKSGNPDMLPSEQNGSIKKSGFQIILFLIAIFLMFFSLQSMVLKSDR